MIAALRRWARSHTEENRYSPVGIAFHWIMAFLVLFQLGWGFYIGFMGVGGDKIGAYQVHSAAGLPILLLAIGRVAWRFLIPGPINDGDRQHWLKRRLAYGVEYLFYVCFFLMPISGWVMWSSVAEPGPLHLAGVLPWPRLPLEELSLATRWALMDIAEDVHHLLAWLLVLIVPLHVLAALKHHFWDRHDVLRGMLPEIPDAEDPRGGHRHKPPEPHARPGGAAG